MTFEYYGSDTVNLDFFNFEIKTDKNLVYDALGTYPKDIPGFSHDSNFTFKVYFNEIPEDETPKELIFDHWKFGESIYELKEKPLY